MRKNFGAQPWLFPMPVLILSAYGEDGLPVSMAAGWAGIRDPEHLSVCILESHKTTRAIQFSGAFTAGIADRAHIVGCDYVGSVSGYEVPDKVERAGFHVTRSEFVNAPLIDELPMSLECEFVSFEPETGYLVGKIINVSADEKALDERGKVDADRFETLTYDPVANAYRTLGPLVGKATEMGNSLK